MLEKLEEKLVAINNNLQQSVVNHNVLLGAKQLLEQLIEEEKKDNIAEPIKDEEILP